MTYPINPNLIMKAPIVLVGFGVWGILPGSQAEASRGLAEGGADRVQSKVLAACRAITS